MTSNVVERAKAAIRRQLELGSSYEIKMEDEFVGVLGADSLDLVEIVMALEEEFEIEASDEAAERCGTVGEAIDLIHTLLKTPSSQKRAEMKPGSSFVWEEETWVIEIVGPVQTLVKKSGTQFFLNVETAKIEYAVELHNKEIA